MTFELCYSLRLISKESNKKPIIQLHIYSIHCVKKRQTFWNVNNSWRLVTTRLTGPKDWYKRSWIHNGPKASLYRHNQWVLTFRTRRKFRKFNKIILVSVVVGKFAKIIMCCIETILFKSRYNFKLNIPSLSKRFRSVHLTL